MNVTRIRTRGGRLLRPAAMLMITIVLFLCQMNSNVTVAQGVETIFDIVPDAATLATLPSTGTTFYLQGKIYFFRTVNPATCQFETANPRQLGTWRAWGEVADDGRLVMNHSLLLSAIGGTVEIQGVTGVVLGTGPAAPAIPGNRTGPTTGPTEVLSVTGGAGLYRALNGEAQVRSYCSDPTRPFRYDRPFCLGIIEGRRR